MATLAENLQTILTNTPKVYNAGYEAGRNSLPTPQWKLVNTINLMDGYCQLVKNEQSEPIEIGGNIYVEYSFYVNNFYVEPEGLAGTIRIVWTLPCPAAQVDPEPTDNFTVHMQNWFAGGDENYGAIYYEQLRRTNGVVEPLSFVEFVPESTFPQMAGSAVCFIKMIQPDPENPEYLEEGSLPTEWIVEIYQLEGIEL